MSFGLENVRLILIAYITDKDIFNVPQLIYQKAYPCFCEEKYYRQILY